MVTIIYYSDTGTNARIAGAIAEARNAEVREIKSIRRYTFLGKVFGSRRGRRFPIQPMDADLSRSEGIILCAPVWAGGPACQLMTFVDQADWNGKKVAVIFGCGGLQPERALRIIRAALEDKGAKVVAAEVLNVGKLKGEALTNAARALCGSIASMFS